jgi:hypothetical protein
METQKAVEDYRKSLNEQLRALYYLINIFRAIKPRRISCTWHGEGGKTKQSFGWKNLKERFYLEDLNADGKKLSKYISKK